MQAQDPMSRTASPRVRGVQKRGRSLLLDPLTNKGTAFTLTERETLGLLGLLPPAICTIEQQLQRTYENYRSQPDDLAKYVYLAALHDRNEVLFFRMLYEHVEEMMPIVYTPTVGKACQRFSHIYRRARGVYVTLRHRGRIAEVLRNWHTQRPSVIVVTDGERILGLGDQGAGGMGIPVGKLCLYTLCAGIPPWTTLPIMLDVGTDNEERLSDPLYLGIRRKRLRGDEYQRLVDEFVEAIRTVFPEAILQWEDFLKENALLQLDRFRDQLPTFNDDIQGTAAVVLAGLYAAMRATGERLAAQRLMIAGAGASAQGIAQLFVAALREEGLSEVEAQRRVWMVDRRGLVVEDRPGLQDFKRTFARSRDELVGGAFRDPASISLFEAVAHVRPTILLGTSATPGLFTEQIVRTMAAHVRRPVIFPLSNPTEKAECTPQDALRWTDGRALIATGSPFEPVVLEGKRHRIGQCNNSFVFPGLGLGAWVGRVRRIHEGLFLAAARALADCVGPADLDEGALFPALSDVREVSARVAIATLRQAIADGLARIDAGADVEGLVRGAMWFPDYPTLVPAEEDNP